MAHRAVWTISSMDPHAQDNHAARASARTASTVKSVTLLDDIRDDAQVLLLVLPLLLFVLPLLHDDDDDDTSLRQVSLKFSQSLFEFSFAMAPITIFRSEFP